MSFRGSAEASFVQHLFRNYYEKHYNNPFIPTQFDRREFGYMLFGQKIMVRHLSFRSFEELKKTLAREAPLHVYRSAAVYQYPQAPMEEKGWSGAELIFDIDADHLETSCKQVHDYCLCWGCGTVLESKASKCPKCGGGDVAEVNMVCEECLNKTKKELEKLIDFLSVDFGVEPSEMVISFSGNRGYHLAVCSDQIMQLDRAARLEVVEYITGAHIELRLHGFSLTSADRSGPGFEDWGWGGRISRSCRSLLERLSARDEEVRRKLSERLKPKDLDNLAEVARYWRDSPRWDLLKTGKRSPYLETLINFAVAESASHVDTVVTTDVHRLLRLADTLNGKTGLKACTVRLEDLPCFNPLRDGVVLDGEQSVEVRVFPTPSFKLGEESYGPYGNEVVKLPVYAAAYLLCRGLAMLAKR
ncbi:MAG: DNA primase small subunit PriS [Candidatus Caldarchaeum sp.]|uniref:DNA primase small subunit PriS n=1 Tax=Caldiarchaeum subterraneum TaxID=311458 RepID=A0A7C5LC76_CALS0